MLKARAEAADASVGAAMGCKSDKARLLQMQQQIHLEKPKWGEEAAVTQAHWEAMSDALCWGRFDNISTAGLLTPADNLGQKCHVSSAIHAI